MTTYSHFTAKLRKARSASAQSGYHYALGLPQIIGEALREDMLFTVHLTDDGILYRPVKNTAAPVLDDVPAWVKDAS